MTRAEAGSAPRLAADEWLGLRLSVPSWRLLVGDDPVDVGAAVKALGDGPSFVFARVPTDRVEALHAFEAAGFHVVDTAVRFRREGIDGLPGGGPGVGFAEPSDERGVVEVARRAFTWSRFHLDPQIETEVADDLKAAWAESWFHGGRGDAMVVARDDSGPCGFLQLLVAGDVVTIDLIGVAERCRGRGLGARMIGFAAQALSPAALEVGTQAANVASLRFYEGLGFRIASSAFVVHRHGGGA